MGSVRRELVQFARLKPPVLSPSSAPHLAEIVAPRAFGLSATPNEIGKNECIEVTDARGLSQRVPSFVLGVAAIPDKEHEGEAGSGRMTSAIRAADSPWARGGGVD